MLSLVMVAGMLTLEGIARMTNDEIVTEV